MLTEHHLQLPRIDPYDLPDPDPTTAASLEGWRVRSLKRIGEEALEGVRILFGLGGGEKLSPAP